MNIYKLKMFLEDACFRLGLAVCSVLFVSFLCVAVSLRFVKNLIIGERND